MTAAIIDLVPRIAASRQRQVDADLVSACEQLLQLAEDGTITGLALIGLQHGHRYFVDSAGMAASRGAITCGMMLALDEHLLNAERVVPQ